MSHEKIKILSSKKFSECDYLLAFEELWKIGANKFVAYCQKVSATKTNWLIDPKSSPIFWEEFAIKEEVFDALFQGKHGELLLYIYFTECKLFSQTFLEKLSKHHPQLLVKGIRINGIFLNENHLELLCKLSLPADLTIHQEVWKILQSTELEIWQNVNSGMDRLNGNDLKDILSDTIIWLEINRFGNNNRKRVNHLAVVYSFFIELLFSSEYRNKWNMNKDLDEGTFFNSFVRRFENAGNSKDKIPDSPIPQLLASISNLLGFRNTVLNTYRYSHDLIPIQENGLIYLQTSPEETYQWRVNGVRYDAIQLRYLKMGASFVEEVEQSGYMAIPKGRTAEDKDINRVLAGMKFATLFMLEEMEISCMTIGNVSVKAEDVLSPLIAFSFNKLFRYERDLTLFEKSTSDWHEAMRNIFLKAIQQDIRREPYIFMEKEDFIKLNQEAIKQMPADIPDHILSLFSYKPSDEKAFDRFNAEYEVWQQPYVHFSKYIFCPLIFFGTNVWFYSFIQECLIQRKGKRLYKHEIMSMEQQLGKKLKNKGWNARVLDDKEANEMDGDIDILIEDHEVAIWIQLKRTYLRLNAKDRYYESETVDRKAAKQLQMAELTLLKTKPSYYGNKRIVKWIVSTSFEDILKIVDGCLKINYFELINAIADPEVKTLNQFIESIEKDKNIQLLYDGFQNSSTPFEQRGLIASLGLPIDLFESHAYRILLPSEQNVSASLYFENYNRALEFDKAGKKEEALILFQSCIKANDRDGDVWGAMANTLADLGYRKEALAAFERGLSLLPGDPTIMRNYSLALLEFGDHFSGLKFSQELYLKYPLMANLKSEFEINLKNCLNLGLLFIDEISHLNKKRPMQ